MLTLKVVDSSSKGNCFAIKDNDRYLLLECGVRDTKKYVNLSKTDGILISHQHLDHCRDVKDIKNYYTGKFYANKDVLEVLPILDSQKQEVKAGEKFRVGNFEVMPFDVVHDVHNTNYLLKHLPSSMKILFVIDTGSIGQCRFKDLDVVIIESNCFESELTYEDYKEIRLYDTHLSCEQCSNFLKENTNHNTKKVILCHISTSEQDYLKHERYIKDVISNENIEVKAIDPHMQEPLEIVLKEDLNQFNFD